MSEYEPRHSANREGASSPDYEGRHARKEGR